MPHDVVLTHDGKLLFAYASGKTVRGTLEQSMVEWADKLGVQCTIIEHPHLLTTHAGFTITGPRHKQVSWSAYADVARTAWLPSGRRVNGFPWTVRRVLVLSGGDCPGAFV